MKKYYEEPEMEVLSVVTEDIIMISEEKEEGGFEGWD